ncbi:MAG: diguanylate cyclase [Candidatus Schekmanbacteria bacterium]|nr:MAG: diguanylate cyclase [Candidatus Schekmanbacteria bacterium]
MNSIKQGILTIKQNQPLKNEEKHKILVIDDEEVMRCMLNDVLTDEGFDVELASNGFEGIGKIKSNNYDLIITDIVMPELDGMEVLKKAKEISPNSDVLVMTGYASVETAVKSMRLGATDYIVKPFNIEQIQIVVQRTIEKRQLQRKAEEGEFYRELSQIDGLTEVYNHRFFHQLLEAEINRCKRYNRPVSVLMLDIDYFKEYNDANGHPAGDILLKQMAWLLTKSCRDCDYVARYGGDEFCVIFPETDEKESFTIVKRLRDVISETHFDRQEVLPQGKVTVSMGLASFPKNATDKKSLIECADKALYAAKKKGKNLLVLSSDIQK